MTLVLPPDLELFLTQYLREHLRSGGFDVEVTNKEPADLIEPLSRPLVVVRDDSGQQDSPISFQRSVGVSVLAGTRQDDSQARYLARLAYGLLTGHSVIEADGSPIAAVDPGGCNGPYAVVDRMDVSRQYFTAAYRAVGEW